MATKDTYILEIETEQAVRGLDRVKTGMGAVGGAAGTLKGVLGPLAAGLAAIGAVNIVGNKINEMDDLAKAAREAGAATSQDAFEGFQAMKFAMAEAGVDAGTFSRAMLQTTNRLQKGVEGQKSFVKITDKLGDSILKSNGQLKEGPALLEAMINALNEGTITTEDFAKVVGGRAGPVIQAQFASLNTTADQLSKTLAEAKGNADIIDLEAAENAEVFNDNLGRLKEGMAKLLTEAVTPLLPHLVNLSENLLANMPKFIEGVQVAFEKLSPVFDLIGTVLTDIVFPILDKVFTVLGGIASAITPLVEAAIPALKAGFEGIVAIVESVIGVFQRAIELLGKIGEKAAALKEKVGDALSSAGEGISNLASAAGSKISGAASATGEAVSDFFAGLFANGGTIPAGKFGIVGEAGPELVGGPATVTPMNGFGQNVTYNIQAVDAASFRALVAREPDFIHAVAQKGAKRFIGGR